MARVSGLDVLAFSGFDNELDDFLNGFLSTGYDLLDRLFTGFLVNGAENLSLWLGKGFEYVLGIFGGNDLLWCLCSDE